jgi:hypothetical protein
VGIISISTFLFLIKLEMINAFACNILVLFSSIAFQYHHKETVANETFLNKSTAEEKQICHEFSIYHGRFVGRELKLISNLVFCSFMTYFWFCTHFISPTRNKNHSHAVKLSVHFPFPLFHVPNHSCRR